MKKFTDNVIGSIAAVNVYSLGYLSNFLGRITTASAFGLSMSFQSGDLGKAIEFSTAYSLF